MLAETVSQSAITLDSATAVLTECHRRGIVLWATDVGIKCRAPKGSMTTELQTAVSSHRDNLRRLLVHAAPTASVDAPALPPPVPSASRDQVVIDWPPDVGAAANFVMLLTVDDLPPAPFEFGPGCRIVDATKFLASLQTDVRCGPRGPRNRFGAVQSDLRRLRDLLLYAHSLAIETEKLP